MDDDVDPGLFPTSLESLVPSWSTQDLGKLQLSDNAVTKSRGRGRARIKLWDRKWLRTAHEGTEAHLSEKALQQALCTMAPALNQGYTEGRVFWDFSISEAATLGTLKPDGHGRLRQEEAYQTSIPHQAVLVEVKTPSTFKKGEGRYVV
jgi:hypothetical protein